MPRAANKKEPSASGNDVLTFCNEFLELCNAFKAKVGTGEAFDKAFAELSPEEQGNTAGLFQVMSIVITGYSNMANHTDGDLIGMTADHAQLINLMAAIDPAKVSNMVAHELIDGFMRHFDGQVRMMPRRWIDVFEDFYPDDDGEETPATPEQPEAVH